MNRSHRSAQPEKRSRLATLFLLGSLLTVLLVLYGALLASAGANPTALPTAALTLGPTMQIGCCSDEEEDNKPHLLAASYYSVKKNLRAKLLLNNKGPRPLEVKPTLFSLSGDRYDILPITVEANSFQMIDMREWIDAAGTQFREGSIQLFHVGRDLVLGSQVYLVNERRSLSFEEKLIEPANGRSSRLQGLWWLPSKDGEVLLAISNTSDLPVRVKVKADGTKAAKKAKVTIDLVPHETRLIDVERDIFGESRSIMPRFGALIVEHNGQSGAVIARGMAQDADQGYSLAIQFLDPLASKSTKLQGAGLRLREADHHGLKPVVIAHNAGASESTITGRLPYRTSDGGTAVVSLPEVRLSPGETSTINIAKALKVSGVPDDVTAAGLEFEHTNEPGSVLISAFTVSDNGDQLFRLPLWDIAAQRSATGGYPWYIEGTSSTYVYLKNVTDQPQEYTFQLDYESGLYSLGLKKIEPGQVITIDVRALRDEQLPDTNGNTIPMEATRGQILWSVRGPDILGMIGRSEQTDLKQAVSNNYACQNCCGNTLNSVWVAPPSSNITVGAAALFVAWEQDRTCYNQLLTPYTVVNANWFSSNNSIASVSGGLVIGNGPGGAGITATWTAYVRYMVGGQFGSSCQVTNANVNPGAGVNVAGVSISGPRTVQDGGFLTPTFTLTPQGGTPNSYQWSWSAPPGSGNNPLVTFNPSNGASTTTNSRWFANPNVPCPSPPSVHNPPVASDPYYNSVYTITGQANFSGGSAQQNTTLTINNFWNPAGTTAPPVISGGPVIGFNPSLNVWVVVNPGSFTRNAPVVVINVPANSQFRNKTVVHENRHVQQYVSGMNSDLFLVSSLMTQVASLTDPTEAGLIAKIVQARDAWDNGQVLFVDLRRTAMEADAHAVSDIVLPQYAYQGCQ